MAKEPLYELIQKLSASEKRYFRLYAQKQSGRGSREYLALFGALEKQTVYNEAALVKALPNPTFAKNLSSGKNYLYQLILKSLRGYHADRRALFQVYGLLQDIHILMEKNLMDQAAKRLRKAKKLAGKYFFNLPYLELLLLDRQLIRSYQTRQAEEYIARNHQESRDWLEQLIGLFDMLNFYDETFLAIRNRMQLEDPEGTISQLLKEHSSKIKINHFSFETKMSYHLTWTNYYLVVKGEMEHAQIHMKNILDLFEDNPHLINEYDIRYINVVHNYLNILYLQKEFDPFPHYLAKLAAIKPRSEKLRIKLFETRYSLRLSALLEQQRYSEALDILPEVKEGLESYDKKMQKVFLLEFWQNIALIYFHLGQLEQAQEWLLKCISIERQDIRQDVQIFCRILTLIIHWELGNDQLVESQARSLLRSKSKSLENQYAQIVARHLLRSIDREVGNRRSLLEELQEELSMAPAGANGAEELGHWLGRVLG